MGSLSAVNSIDRVLQAHAAELKKDFMDQVPPSLKPQVRSVILSNNTYSVQTEWEFQDGSTIPGPSIEIDELADRFPDCDVGY